MLTANTGSAATTFSLTGIGAGAHYVRVRAVTSAGTSGPSNEVTVSGSGGPPPPPGPPPPDGSAPSNLTAFVSGSTVSLNWTAPTSGGAVSSYIVEVGSTSGASNLLTVNTGSAATTFSLTGIGAGTHYVRVRAVTSAGTSGPSNEVQFAR
jgi:predicted phage tail protein